MTGRERPYAVAGGGTAAHTGQDGRTGPGVQTDAGLLSPVRAGTPAEAAACDTAWLQAMLDAEAALVRAQARLKAVPESAADVISRTARAGNLDVRELALEARETANPVVGLVRALTRAVADEDPAAAEYVHRGSTSQDVFDTGAMLVASRVLSIIRADLERAAAALARLAEQHLDTPMAGRTLALHAVPTTFGLKAAGWRESLLGARERLDRLAAEGLPVSLGGAAGTLAGYLAYADTDGALTAEERAGYHTMLLDAFADEAGLVVTPLPWHSLRAPVADLAAGLAFTVGALGKIAVDVQSLARTEVGEVAEPGGEGRGSSSAMPHKRNPVLSTLVRSAAMQVPAMAAALTQCLVSEDERSAGAWHAEWQLLRECLRLTGGAAHTAVALLEGLEVDAERMRANLAMTGGRAAAERITARLAPELGKAAAQKLLSHASATAVASGRPLRDVLAESPELAGRFTGDELDELCDPANYTGAARALAEQAVSAGSGGPSRERS